MGLHFVSALQRMTHILLGLADALSFSLPLSFFACFAIGAARSGCGFTFSEQCIPLFLCSIHPWCIPVVAL